jgi:NADH-quinone oxidoreductase subunit G
MFALKLMMEKLGSPNVDCRQDGAKLDPSLGRGSYIFNATIAGIEKADTLLIIGSNPRREAPVLNARIRKRWRVGNFPVGLIGEAVDLTYDYKYIGAGAESLSDVVAGKGLGEDFVKAARPLVIIGQGALTRSDGAAILALAAKAAGTTEGWAGFSILHTAAARVGGLDLGFVPQAGGKDALAMAEAGALGVLFNLGADEIDIAPGAFVIYQGTHGDRGAHRADVILPGATYTEKSGTYVNTEGRVQIADRACFPPGDAREDWAILRALSDVLGVRFPFDSLAQLRRALYERHPHFSRVDRIERGGDVAPLAASAGQATTEKAGFVAAVQDFYLTNPIARASAVMAECSALARGQMRQAAE